MKNYGFSLFCFNYYNKIYLTVFNYLIHQADELQYVVLTFPAANNLFYTYILLKLWSIMLEKDTIY